MYLSIIIPTLEEEKYLPFLLDSIKRQGLLFEYEIIVADGGSKDRTVEIAKNYGCKVVVGGLPAKGRNEGVKVAKGELLLFIDADVILPDYSLGKILSEFTSRNLGVAAFLLRPWSKDAFLKMLYDIFWNLPSLILEKTSPRSVGTMLVKKAIFDKTDGFDEASVFLEDYQFVREAGMFGRFGFLRSVKIFHSERRLKKYGPVRSYFQYVFGELYFMIFGPIRSNIFGYDMSSRRFKD